MPAPITLDERIAALGAEVDEMIRKELRQLLRILRDVGYPEGVLDTMMRLGLRLTARLYEAVGLMPSSDNLFSRLEELARQRYLPEEMASYLHLIRILSNKPHHNAEKVRLQISDAENVLNGFLRVLEWFYCEFEYGPRLRTIYSDESSTPVTLTQMLESFLKSQQVNEEEKRLLEAELERLRAEQTTADRHNRKIMHERVVGPVPSSVVQHFKDRLLELRTLREWLANENLRLILICGRGGMGKTTLITKLLYDIQLDFTLRLDAIALEVDSIVYITLRQSELRSPDKIVELICRTLEPDAAQELKVKWQEKTSMADKLEFLFHRILGKRRYLIVLDNFEDVLDDENRIREEFADLRQFVEKCLEYDHGARLIVTSRRTLVLPPELEGRIGERRAELPLDEGLPEDEAITLLRELDTDGRLGIRDAPDETLRTVVRRCHRIPRTLETLIGTLRQRRTWTLARLLQDQTTFARLIENPARELYESLSPEERLVIQALAIYDRPVPSVAVRYLLPALPVDEILDTLVRNYVVNYDRDQFSLHPLDAQYAYHQIPDGDGDYTKSALHQRAAAFFRKLRKPKEEWKSIEDLEPQLQEFYHLVRAGLYDEACRLVNEIDYDYLQFWGCSSLILELRSQLLNHLHEPDLQEYNWGYIGLALRRLGELQRAKECLERAIAIALEHESKRALPIWLSNLGLTYNLLKGTPKAGISYLEQALSISREISDRLWEGWCLHWLGEAFGGLSDIWKQIEYCGQALAIAEEIGDKRMQVAALIGLGNACVRLGETQKAFKHYERALRISREIGYRIGELRSLWTLGYIHFVSGEVERAIEFYQQSLTIARQVGAQVDEWGLLYHLGYACHYFGNLTDARRCYEEVLALNIPETNHIICAVKLGILCLEEGKEAEARDFFTRGIALCRKLMDNSLHSYEVLYHLALAQLGSEQADEALATYQQALSVCSDKGVVESALQDLKLLKRAKQVVGLDEAIALLESKLIK